MINAAIDMKSEWNARAEKDAYHYVETAFWKHDRQEFFSLGEERARILIDPVLKKLGFESVGKTAVDLGCGVGRFTQALARRFSKAVGIDVSDSMVSQAIEAANGSSNLQFAASDGVLLPEPTGSADFVWSYEVFQHMPSHEVIRSNLYEVARILRPDGYALLHFRTGHERPGLLWNVAWLLPTSLIRNAKRVRGNDPLTADRSWRGAKPLSKNGIQQMCQDAGLKIIEFRDDPTHNPGSRIFAVVQRAF